MQRKELKKDISANHIMLLYSQVNIYGRYHFFAGIVAKRSADNSMKPYFTD